MTFEKPEPENWLKVVESAQDNYNKNYSQKTKKSKPKEREDKIIAEIEKMQSSRKKDKSHFYDSFIQKKRN